MSDTTEKKPRAVEAGRITTLGFDGEVSEIPMALVIEFSSAEQIREAIKTGRVEFTFLE